MRRFLRAEDLWHLVQNESIQSLDLESFQVLIEAQKVQKYELALRFI